MLLRFGEPAFAVLAPKNLGEKGHSGWWNPKQSCDRGTEDLGALINLTSRCLAAAGCTLRWQHWRRMGTRSVNAMEGRR